MTIKNALILATQKLAKNNFDSAQLDAEILLSRVLGQSKEFLYANPEFKLNWLQKIRFFYLIKRRLKNWPIAYLIHNKEFYGYAFYVNKYVLTPRPLTEGIIDLALEIINNAKDKKQKYVIADIGTGSGCIIITLISELQKANYPLDNFKFYATDISKKALKVAKKNARFHQVEKQIEFLRGDLLKPFAGKKIDLILANLPYLENEEDLKERSIKKEPKLALLGDYTEFFKQVSKLNYQPKVIYEDKAGINLKKRAPAKNENRSSAPILITLASTFIKWIGQWFF